MTTGIINWHHPSVGMFFLMKPTSKDQALRTLLNPPATTPGGPNLLEQEVPCGGQTPCFLPGIKHGKEKFGDPKNICIEIGNNIFNGRCSIATVDCRRTKIFKTVSYPQDFKITQRTVL